MPENGALAALPSSDTSFQLVIPFRAPGSTPDDLWALLVFSVLLLLCVLCVAGLGRQLFLWKSARSPPPSPEKNRKRELVLPTGQPVTVYLHGART